MNWLQYTRQPYTIYQHHPRKLLQYLSGVPTSLYKAIMYQDSFPNTLTQENRFNKGEYLQQPTRHLSISCSVTSHDKKQIHHLLPTK
jgi:hypothetical protein